MCALADTCTEDSSIGDVDARSSEGLGHRAFGVDVAGVDLLEVEAGLGKRAVTDRAVGIPTAGRVGLAGDEVPLLIGIPVASEPIRRVVEAVSVIGGTEAEQVIAETVESVTPDGERVVGAGGGEAAHHVAQVIGDASHPVNEAVGIPTVLAEEVLQQTAEIVGVATGGWLAAEIRVPALDEHAERCHGGEFVPTQ